MAHCPPELLADLVDVLDEIRSWPGIKEKSFACFYLKSQGFAHFHVKDGERWADARRGKSWGEPIPIAIEASKAQRQKFLKTLRGYYDETVGLGK